MASRRSRIKGIANIPQRRNIVEGPSVKLETEIVKIDKSDIINGIKPLTEGEQTICNQERNINTLNSDNVNPQDTFTQKATENYNEIKKTEILSSVNVSNLEVQSTALLTPTEEIHNLTNIELNNSNRTKLPLRRKFIKPTVNILCKKPKLSAENTEEIKSLQEDISQSIQITKNDTDSIKSKLNIDSSTFNNSHFKEKCGAVITLNLNNDTEITFNDINEEPGAPSVSQVLPNSVIDGDQKHLTVLNLFSPQGDTEYPPPPPSPSITNRARIKAVPKLNFRKTSFSASESEDETRKTYRIRNDSVCSITSLTSDTPTENFSTQKPREINTIIQKKCNRTEQTRKLAEARREFHRRFGSNAPDRQKLTMMDLIFYNPDTNPMEKSESKPKLNSSETLESAPENNPPVADTDKSDEENDIPVPQIKIGPSGEIILDEKSLVVERKDIKKQREEIARSEVVNADIDTSYGIYKKHKRSKFWTADETLRFYKALNTLGTDFTLMCELFPERTRRELKMKFNKEEKINKTLVDKALMQPCGFDFYVLKKEVELEQIEKAELEKIKLEEHRKKEEKKQKEILRKKKKPNETEGIPNFETKQLQRPIVKKLKSKKININTILDETEDADESDIETNSEDEVISSHKPTRSGRLPKVPRKFDVNDEMVVEKIVKKSQEDIQPGSIMIITEKGTNEEPIYKIFMITQDQEKIPLEFNSDEDAKAIQLRKGITAKNILTISAIHTDDEEIEEETLLPIENNMTIPEDKSVTTLKSIPLVLPKNSEGDIEPTKYKTDISKKQDGIEVQSISNDSRKEFDVCDQIFESLNHLHKSDATEIILRKNSAVSTTSFKESRPEEKNITIPADENVTSLRPTKTLTVDHNSSVIPSTEGSM